MIFTVAEVEVKKVEKFDAKERLTIVIKSFKEYSKSAEYGDSVEDLTVGQELWLTPTRYFEDNPSPAIIDLTTVLNKNVEVIMTCNTACIGEITKEL